ncbi:MAG: sigma-70 family RNA polymerase sigma factor [Anaerolineales bacterium]
MQPEEQALVKALHGGDQDACRELIDQYGGQIYGVALRLMRNPDEAEDVLQETFIDACNAVSDFEARSSLGTWLYRIATNNSLMRLRRPDDPTVPLDAPELTEPADLPQQLNAWPGAPEEMFLNDELRQHLEVAIDDLPDALRPAFVLRDIEGLSTREAAEVLGITSGALKVRLHRARLQLRESLADYFQETEPVGGER